MNVQYLTQIAVASVLSLSLLAGCNSTPTETPSSPAVETSNPCASKENPCASKSNPCASKENPCASKSNPCASKENPCASKSNPCASKENPCASKQGKTEPAVFADKGLAIRGYDPVAYFTAKQPVKGTKELTFEWKGTTWQFSTAANRDLFAKEPEKYAPQYGGYCAFAVSEGNLAPIDPQAWSVVDGKLYLNYSKGIQKEWSKDIPGNITKANQNWPGVLSKS